MNHYKNRYHPMIILLYHSKMLSPEQIEHIPRSTQSNWTYFSHQDYFGYEMAKDYIADFEYIKEVLTKKHLNKAMKFACRISFGYQSFIQKMEANKKLLRESSANISFSIKHIAKKGNINIADACRFFGVSTHWYYRHRKPKGCVSSLIRKCFRHYPNQLTKQEVETIETIVSLPENKGKTKTTLYYDALRKGIISCGKSTFSKYADLLGYNRSKRKKFNKKSSSEPRATRIFEWLHVDVTHVQTQSEGIQKVAFVKDNFSGALLHYKSTADSANSQFIKELFEETFKKYNLQDLRKPINILSDGGPENKGAFLDWINQIKAPSAVTKITANTPDFPFSNNMSESTHRIYKSEFMQHKFSYDLAAHLKDLDKFMIYSNEQRYPIKHFGNSPLEVLKGAIPDKHQFTDQIKAAQIIRRELNRTFNQCPVLCMR